MSSHSRKLEQQAFADQCTRLQNAMLEKQVMEQINAKPELRAKADAMVKEVSDSMPLRLF